MHTVLSEQFVSALQLFKTAALRQTLQALRQMLQAFRQGLQALRQTLQAFRQTLQTLRQTLQAFRQTLQTLRQMLQAFRQTLQALRQTLRFPPRYMSHVHMWQSWVEIEHYFVAQFDHFTAFEVICAT